MIPIGCRKGGYVYFSSPIHPRYLSAYTAYYFLSKVPEPFLLRSSIAYMQKSIALFPALLLSIFLAGQEKSPDTSYTLLWYQGKKIKNNVLLTPKKDTVRFDPSKSIVKVSSKTGKGKELDNLFAELNKTPQRVNEMISRVKAGMPKTVVPYYANIVTDAYTSIQQELSPILSNALAIPSETFARASAAATGHGPYASFEPAEQTFDEAMQEVLDFYEKHKNETIFYVPTPPRREFSYCLMNNKAVAANYERDFEQFRKDLVGRDEDIFQLCLKLYHHSEVFLDNEGKLDTDKKLTPVTSMLLKRQYDRAMLLINQFSNDPYRCWSVFRMSLLIDRQLALVGWYDEAQTIYIVWSSMENAIKSWALMFEKAMQDYDYPVALNIYAILGIERIAQLHDLDYNIPLDKLIKFNRFKLNMHVSSKISVDGGYQLAELNGDNWFSALPDSSGRLVWILIGPLVNKVSMTLVAAEFRGKIDFPYIGTRKWESQYPKMKIDFCDQQKDTLDIYMFHADGFKETWVFPQPQGAIDINIVPGILAATFLDVERINNNRNEIKNDPAVMERMKKDMLAKLEQMKKNGAAMPVANKGSMTTMQLAGMAEFRKLQHEMMQNSKQYDPLKFVFKPQPQKRSPVLLQEKLNGKELFPQNTSTEYAWFHLKLEQDPGCPFQPHL